MKNRNKNNVLPQMFDIRPLDESGDLDLEKIGRVRKILRMNRIIAKKEKIAEEIVFEKTFRDAVESDWNRPEAERFARMLREEKETAGEAAIPVSPEASFEGWIISEETADFKRAEPEIPRDYYFSQETLEKEAEKNEWQDFSWGDVFFSTRHFNRHFFRKIGFSFAASALAIFLVIFGLGFFQKSLWVKNSVLEGGGEAYASLLEAGENLTNRDFEASALDFEKAGEKFGEISGNMESLGGILTEAGRFVPYLSKLSSGNYLAKAGQDASRAGALLSDSVKTIDRLGNPLNPENQVSLLDVFQKTEKNLKEVSGLLKSAGKNLEKVNADDLPDGQREKFARLKSTLPEAVSFLDGFLDYGKIFTDVLGGNGPRKYLFLFQNNHEMRATGGFIGTYGILDIRNGRIKKFLIDGIFNPDGQLKENVIPPQPIQKISAAWSLHDSNWFPDFPKSAEKAAWFYEKTGGPTVDGVITVTPTVMQKLLEIIGPVEMPEYGLTIDRDNFMEKIQKEVEADYDKEINQPKKILADLMPKVLDRIFNARDFSEILKTIGVFSESLKEKHILMYSMDYNIQKMLSVEGWSGEILPSRKDYLSVINTNINGYKTDGVVEESVEHSAEIREDGSVVDTVIIRRKHTGGMSEQEWQNKVNADYMRVYVPKGSELLSAEGQTREFVSPPLDYSLLKFKKDPQITMEEDSMTVDEKTGTRIYEDSGKTVFANWIYVSPQEEAVIKYQYLLPFKVVPGEKSRTTDSYSLLAQKQAGSSGDKFVSRIFYPQSNKVIWSYPQENLNFKNENGKNEATLETDLKTDKFLGLAFMNSL